MNHPVFSKDRLEIPQILNATLKKIIQLLISVSRVASSNDPANGRLTKEYGFDSRKGKTHLYRGSRPVLEPTRPPPQREPEGFPYTKRGRGLRLITSILCEVKDGRSSSFSLQVLCITHITGQRKVFLVRELNSVSRNISQTSLNSPLAKLNSDISQWTRPL